MTQRKNKSEQSKISPEFKARLDRLGSQQQVRAIILIQTQTSEEAPSGRHAPAEREAAIEAMHRSVETALIDIDHILARFDGKRLATNVNALGYIPIETTAAGVSALAKSEHVKAIFEDQPISLLPRLK